MSSAIMKTIFGRFAPTLRTLVSWLQDVIVGKANPVAPTATDRRKERRLISSRASITLIVFGSPTEVIVACF
jgi:hypothetical protein